MGIYGPSNTDLSQANQQWQWLLPMTTGAAYSQGQLPQQVQQLTSNFQNNPYAAQAQAGAGTASAYGTGTVVPQMQQGVAGLQGLGQTNASYVPQALATGFDPQNALYNRNYQQTIDQQNAINSMSGVSNSPYGAGVTGKVGADFNLDWADRALGRQATAAGTANTLTGASNTGFTGAANLGAGAVTEEASASGLPSSTYQTNIMDTLKALAGGTSVAGGAQALDDTAMQQILSYLGYGSGVQEAKQQQSNAEMSGVGQGLGALAALAFL